MIRVLLVTPLTDDDIPVEANSVNSVFFDGQDRMALYFRQMPIPTSLNSENILDIYDAG